ncbi:MAG: PHP domain-containing protein [Treponema sp.]|jgi:predicted metal-dependent phosphoesterase TrpH|nr:PHP domain-containing protein [Treponema sp.]
MIDLHTHSSASDGSLSPAALMAAAAERGLSAIALTDHDTIKGLDEARLAAETLGIRFIPGVELEIQWPQKRSGFQPAPGTGEFHLLGLGIRAPSPSFIEALDELSRRREERNLKILETMDSMGIKAAYNELKTGGGSVGRLHFAALLVQRGIVKNREQAFSRYLARGKPLYKAKEGLELDRALKCIKESGGIAVLAHPMSLYVSWGRLPDLIKSFAAQGLDGIEAWHPTAKPRTCKRLEELALSLGLRVSAGSDFHGAARPDLKLGITAGDRKIDDAILEAIPELADNGPLWGR